MDAVSDPTIREIWVQKSAQVGWTEVLGNVVGFHVHQDPAPILLVQPTLEMAEAWSKDRLAPMIRDTPALRDKFADAKARDSGNTLLHKRFAGGHLTMAGANSPAGLASRPIRIVLFDEVDRFPNSAGAEGDPINLGKKRATTFWNRKILAGSTPTVKGSSRIEAGFSASDQRFYFVPCPHCEEFQRLVWTNVRWDDDDPTSAHYVCEHCGTLLNDADKAEMLLRGQWRATKPFNGIAGFHVWEAYSNFVRFEQIVRDFLEAKKLPETLQTWINTSLGETWEDKGESVEPKGLAARREAYTANSLPPGVLCLTAGVDVQDDRLEVTVWGWGADEENWRVEHIVLRGDPGGTALWAELDNVWRKRWPTDDGRQLIVEAAGVDSGGHYTDQVYRYCHARARYRIWAVKGVGGAGRPVWPERPGRGKKTRVQVWSVGVDTAKDTLYGRLKRVAAPGAGYTHFDADADDGYLQQLTSETLVYRMVMGRRLRLWKPRSSGIRQEALDCWVYAYAALIGRGGGEMLRQRAGAPAAPQDPKAAAAPADAAPPPARSTGDASLAQKVQQHQQRNRLPGRKRNWVNRFRG